MAAPRLVHLHVRTHASLSLHPSPSRPLRRTRAALGTPPAAPPHQHDRQFVSRDRPYFRCRYGSLVYQLLGDKAESAFVKDWAIGLGMDVRHTELVFCWHVLDGVSAATSGIVSDPNIPRTLATLVRAPLAERVAVEGRVQDGDPGAG